MQLWCRLLHQSRLFHVFTGKNEVAKLAEGDADRRSIERFNLGLETVQIGSGVLLQCARRRRVGVEGVKQRWTGDGGGAKRRVQRAALRV
jgi:hypothetical protein